MLLSHLSVEFGRSYTSSAIAIAIAIAFVVGVLVGRVGDERRLRAIDKR